jgi:hypothetical protein
MLLMQAVALIVENKPEAQTTQPLAPAAEYVLASQEAQTVAAVDGWLW